MVLGQPLLLLLFILEIYSYVYAIIFQLRQLRLHERVLNTPVDPMHLINVVAHCVNMIAGYK